MEKLNAAAQFSRYDVNHDGVLDAIELAKHAASIDKNKDGCVSQQEFLSALSEEAQLEAPTPHGRKARDEIEVMSKVIEVPIEAEDHLRSCSSETGCHHSTSSPLLVPTSAPQKEMTDRPWFQGEHLTLMLTWVLPQISTHKQGFAR